VKRKPVTREHNNVSVCCFMIYSFYRVTLLCSILGIVMDVMFKRFFRSSSMLKFGNDAIENSNSFNKRLASPLLIYLYDCLVNHFVAYSASLTSSFNWLASQSLRRRQASETVDCTICVCVYVCINVCMYVCICECMYI
jgi:hypothetical protein